MAADDSTETRQLMSLEKKYEPEKNGMWENIFSKRAARWQANDGGVSLHCWLEGG